MADVNVKTSPTPIQRNTYDIAIELLQLHRSEEGMSFKAEDIEPTFAKYFALARILDSSSYEELEKLVSKDVLEKMNVKTY